MRTFDSSVLWSPHSEGGGSQPSLPKAQRADRAVDARVRYSFVSLLARVMGEHWECLRVDDRENHSTYPIPRRIGDNSVIFTAARPNFDDATAKNIISLVREQKLRELHIYDTPMTKALLHVCTILEGSIDRLVIRDHHPEEEYAPELIQGLRKMYGDKADIIVEDRKIAPTCFGLLQQHPVCPGSNDMTPVSPKNVLYLNGHLDYDSFNCIAYAMGYRYEGQLNDALRIEARDSRTAPVSKLGVAILDALRVVPWVEGQQGHKTYATLVYLAGFETIGLSNENIELSRTKAVARPGQTLKFLGDIGHAVGQDILATIILDKLKKDHTPVLTDPINVAFIDLSGAEQDVLNRFDIVLSRKPLEIVSNELGVSVEISAREALVALVEDSNRLRLKSVIPAGAQLISEGLLPNDCFIFIKYPSPGGATVTRFASFGRYRDFGFQKPLRFLGKPGRASGDVLNQTELQKWLGFEGK